MFWVSLPALLSPVSLRDFDPPFILPYVIFHTQYSLMICEYLSWLLLLSWISQLESALIQEGLVAVTVDRTSNAESYQGFWNSNFLMLGEEFSSFMLHGEPLAEVNQNATRLREATRRAAVEMQNGVGIRTELILAVGRKPLPITL